MEADSSNLTIFGDVNCDETLPDMPCLKCTGRGQKRPTLEELRLPQVALLEMQIQKDMAAMQERAVAAERERTPRFGKGRAQMRQERCSSGLSGQRSMSTQSSISTLSSIGRTSPLLSNTASTSPVYGSSTADITIEDSDVPSDMHQEADLVYHDADSVCRRHDSDSKQYSNSGNMSVVREDDPHLKGAASSFKNLHTFWK